MTTILANGRLTAAVSDKGAELQSLKGADGLELLWQGDPAFWGRRAPVLFPIVGRLKENRYRWQGRDYSLPQHGFARDRVFTLIAAGNDFARFCLAADDQSRLIYPFEFELEIGYRLIANSLKITWEVKNPAKEDLLFSIGAHPGFNCPLRSGETWADYLLEFDTAGPLVVRKIENGLLSEQEYSLELDNRCLALERPGLFDNDALVFVAPPFNRVSIFNQTTRRGVTLQTGGFPYYGIWSKPGGAPFVCLEPWHGITDSISATGHLNEKMGLERLSPGAVFAATHQIELIS